MVSLARKDTDLIGYKKLSLIAVVKNRGKL